MSAQIPWWTWTAPLWPTLLMMAFVLSAGYLQGRKSGSYPTLRELVDALRALNPATLDRARPENDRSAAVAGRETDQPEPEINAETPREH